MPATATALSGDRPRTIHSVTHCRSRIATTPTPIATTRTLIATTWR
jgi:hypothetical protein